MDDLFRRLSTCPDGLSGDKAGRCLHVYGPNKMNPLLKSLLSFGRLEDFAIIMALLFINVIVKYAQEKKASDAYDVLKLLIYGILDREKVELM
ncbi:hypothetical protein [Methanocella conradii]|uniref:hypothetical protein n=1 Tax=Methanocella conradii TaxID=1175444 RepID=UPI00157DFD10|nr:hypothetical protein [Methanocella conradii]